jgi:hypothetical protein
MSAAPPPPEKALNCSRAYLAWRLVPRALSPHASGFLDVLYFCYSPVWQVSNLYKHGQLDSCAGKWGQLVDCLQLKAKPDSGVRARLEAVTQQPCIWQLRTPDEARAFWATQFPELET